MDSFVRLIDSEMKDNLRPVKWIIIPAMIVLAQIVLNAYGAFETESGMWAFIATSLVILLVWRHRLGKLIFPLTRFEIANTQTMDRSDRRFAFMSSAAPFAVIFAIQLSILLLVAIDLPLVHRHTGTLWTIFAWLIVIDLILIGLLAYVSQGFGVL